MKYQKRRSKSSQFIDAEFADALSCGESHSRGAGIQAQRKAWQFCRQVQRALNFALADGNGVFVEDVRPAPDCGRLMVQILVPPGLPAAGAMGALRRDTPRLRSEVALAITRKRAPELFFVPAFSEGDGHE